MIDKNIFLSEAEVLKISKLITNIQNFGKAHSALTIHF